MIGYAKDIRCAFFNSYPDYQKWVDTYPNNIIIDITPIPQLHGGYSQDPKIFIVYKRQDQKSESPGVSWYSVMDADLDTSGSIQQQHKTQ